MDKKISPISLLNPKKHRTDSFDLVLGSIIGGTSLNGIVHVITTSINALGNATERSYENINYDNPWMAVAIGAAGGVLVANEIVKSHRSSYEAGATEALAAQEDTAEPSEEDPTLEDIG